MNHETVTVQQLRDAMVETDLPALVERTRGAIDAGLPPRPPLPDGVPKDFLEALFTPGVCAIPLWSGDRWRFGCICDGGPIMDALTGGMAMCDTYDEAISNLRAWDANRRSGKAEASQEEQQHEDTK